jgi:four helix bundle protein
MNNSEKAYNLEERTAQFGENIILFCKIIPQTVITKPIISQIIRSATSVGANYCEANNASSRKDFRNKICICKKEAQETKHWLRMVNACVKEKELEIQKLSCECHELLLIFQKIINTLSSNQKKAQITEN